MKTLFEFMLVEPTCERAEVVVCVGVGVGVGVDEGVGVLKLHTDGCPEHVYPL